MAGDQLDEFEILEVLYESRASIIYKVRAANGQLFVLKTLQPLLANDIQSCQALMNEEWLGKRVVSQYVPQVLPLSVEKRRHLYYVMTWHDGVTLQQRLNHSNVHRGVHAAGKRRHRRTPAERPLWSHRDPLHVGHPRRRQR